MISTAFLTQVNKSKILKNINHDFNALYSLSLTELFVEQFAWYENEKAKCCKKLN